MLNMVKKDRIGTKMGLNWKKWTMVGAFSSALILMAGCGAGDKKVYFVNLEDGANVESPFKIQMKAENLIVEPASMGVNDGHGHFHVLVDASFPSSTEPIPKDGTHIHYGGGQTEATLDLPVGQHSLTLEFAKGDHVPYNPAVRQQIHVNVTKQNKVDTTAAAKAPMKDSATAKKDSTAAKSAVTPAPGAGAAAAPVKTKP